MESAITILVVTVFAVGLAAFLGYLAEKWMGAFLLSVLVSIAAAVYLGAAAVGYYYLGGMTAAWMGLFIGIIIGGVILGIGFSNITRVGKSGRFAAGAWFSFWALCTAGYLTAGWIGFLALTLPALLLFWGGLYYISAYILPLRDSRNRSTHNKAFRTLLTFAMGTNYPYYFVDEDGQPEKRVDGNSALQLFAAPGFVYTDANYATYVTSGVFVGGAFEPGLTFTGLYDLEPRILDLRPQVRAFPVEALTKDGIPIKVFTFVPCRIDQGEETFELGRHFPFRTEAVYTLLSQELVERTQNQQEGGKKHEWGGGPLDGLVPLLATPIVQDIISRYTLDQLCEPDNRDRDPRVEIATEVKKQIGEALEPLGLTLVGGGISNLVPQNEDIVKRRLENWRTRWEGQILTQISSAQANRVYLTESARAEVEAEIVALFRRVTRGTNKLDLALALRFIDTLGDLFAKDGQWPILNEELKQRLEHLRGEKEEGKKRQPWLLDIDD